MKFTSQDELYMRQTLALAREGTALASPNPRVGAVVVNATGQVVGTGSHTYEGMKHAEVLALEQAGVAARGGTLYINLEPCSHQGRTPPCADAVIAAGVKRVVAAMEDPNPLVAGKGFAKLRAAGIAVESGLLENEARKLNEAFANHIVTRRPLVTLKTAMTLDAKIAPARGEGSASGWITSIEARAHVQELRHESDAILVGVGTALADNPLLTDRTGRQRRRPLLRVVLDSRLRLPVGSRLVKSAQNDLLVFCSQADEAKQKELEAHGVRVESVRAALDGRPCLKSVIERLGTMEITSLLIEGGSQVNSVVLAEGLADKIFFYFAPRIMGSTAVPFASSGEPAVRIAESGEVRGSGPVTNLTLHRFGDDFAVEGYLRDPYVPSGVVLRGED